MNINTKIESDFLKDLNRILKKYAKTQRVKSGVAYGHSDETQPAALQDHSLPTAAESILSLLTHLAELENKSRLAEKRGELIPLAEVGRIIHVSRKRQKLTVEALADLAGVGTVTIHKVEKGSIHVQAPKLIQIAEALGLELLVSSQ